MVETRLYLHKFCICFDRCLWFAKSKRNGNVSANARVEDYNWSDFDEHELQRALSDAALGAMHMKIK